MLKGGTALKQYYGLDRFSEDIEIVEVKVCSATHKSVALFVCDYFYLRFFVLMVQYTKNVLTLLWKVDIYAG